jgi:hypothetical protein
MWNWSVYLKLTRIYKFSSSRKLCNSIVIVSISSFNTLQSYDIKTLYTDQYIDGMHYISISRYSQKHH